ncbi:MAG: NADH-quinone oxidoreductase subunit N [Chthoniobacteraceae bacterium]|nr:NADH-quinone oxidoreductase subunit N [Chthoniobacteraceae bacterium]
MNFAPLTLDLAVLALGLVLLLLEAFDNAKEKSFLGWISVVGIAAIFGMSFFATTQTAATGQLAQFYTGDALALFFKRFALGTTLLVLIMALEFRPVLSAYIPAAGKNAGLGEFFALPVFTCLGLMWMASAIDFVMIFVALELVTISFYIQVGYMRRSGASLEAGVKYLILGALSTGFFVYGITWVFGVTGQTNLAKVGEALRALPPSGATAAYFAMALLFVGLGFKIAAAPFQLWAPDVYQGAPTPITAFLSVGSKAAGFVVLIRVLGPFLDAHVTSAKAQLVLAAMALLTLVYGNLTAMPQLNLKRLLGYSSIAHAGYLLVALASWNAATTATVSFYLTGYLLMTLLAFLVMIVVQRATGGDNIAHFNGLGQRAPFLAFGMTMAMLSLAGVPFTAGFLGKFFVFADAVNARQWWLVGVGVITVGAGFYYYLKVVRAMYWNVAKNTEPVTASRLTHATIGVLVFLIVLFGVYPAPILNALK